MRSLGESPKKSSKKEKKEEAPLVLGSPLIGALGSLLGLHIECTCCMHHTHHVLLCWVRATGEQHVRPRFTYTHVAHCRKVRFGEAAYQRVTLCYSTSFASFCRGWGLF